MRNGTGRTRDLRASRPSTPCCVKSRWPGLRTDPQLDAVRDMIEVINPIIRGWGNY